MLRKAGWDVRTVIEDDYRHALELSARRHEYARRLQRQLLASLLQGKVDGVIFGVHDAKKPGSRNPGRFDRGKTEA
jgi:hypothetical protein